MITTPSLSRNGRPSATSGGPAPSPPSRARLGAGGARRAGSGGGRRGGIGRGAADASKAGAEARLAEAERQLARGHDARGELTPPEEKLWRAVQDGHRREAAQARAMRPALERANGTNTGGAGAASSSVPAVGRNQPCPCGSGKKYKVCHGAVR